MDCTPPPGKSIKKFLARKLTRWRPFNKENFVKMMDIELTEGEDLEDLTLDKLVDILEKGIVYIWL